MMRKWFYVGIIVTTGSLVSAANTFSWKANITGDWFNAANWTNESGYPSDGDTVMITNAGASVMLTNTTARLADLTVGGASAGLRTLTFTNWETCLYATNLTVLTNGTLTCVGPFTNNWMSNRVNLVCDSKLAIEAGGAINVNGKGYAGDTLLNGYSGPGNGPGGGNGGGSHGGAGRTYANGIRGDLLLPKICGVPEAPLLPGSGGIRGEPGYGGHAGGAVRITASQVIVENGSISADAVKGAGTHNSGGSGGSIFITCTTIAGTNGTMTAGGSDGSGFGGGGGGGRIAVLYTPAAQAVEPLPSIRFSAGSGYGNNDQTMAEPGTLYFPDNALLSPTNLVHTGQWLTPGFTSWSVSDLAVSNAWIRFPGAGFRLTVSNTLAVVGPSNNTTAYLRYRLELPDAAAVSCGQCLLKGAMLNLNCTLSNAYYNVEVLSTNNAGTTGVTMNCSGNLVLTNIARLYVAGGRTNAAAGYKSFGALVNVGGDILIASNSWIYPATHPTNGTVVLLNMRNLTINRYGGINADFLGYAGTRDGSAVPYGPGKGTQNYSGSGHGGVGGKGTSGTGGTTYGSSNAPIDPGSGGWSYSASCAGGWGGGSVQIRAAKTVAIQGTVTANGGQGAHYYRGGASGGSIYITCYTFIGDANGVLQANGGPGDPGGAEWGGGGGGGRIAVKRIFDQSASIISNYVNGGAGNNNTYGTNGTVVWGWLPPPGTIFTAW